MTRPNHGESGIWDMALQNIRTQSKKGDLLLDLGCGVFVWNLPKNFETTVIRVDKNPDVKPDYVFDLNAAISFTDKSFDGILAMEVIEHLENPFHFLRECCRIAKRFIVITTPDPDTPKGRTWLNEDAYFNYNHILAVPSHLIRRYAFTRGFGMANINRNVANYIITLKRISDEIKEGQYF